MRRISWRLSGTFELLSALLAAGALVAIQRAGAQAPNLPPDWAPAQRINAATNSRVAQAQRRSSLPLEAPPVSAPDVVLYDQFNNAATTSTGSQQFEAAFTAFN